MRRGGVRLWGTEKDVGPVSTFVGGISEHDSRAGNSAGALGEVGGGEGIVGGAGAVVSTTGGTVQVTGLAYAGVGAHTPAASGSVGVVGFGSAKTIQGVGIYGEGFVAGRGGGVGAYLNISSLGSCR